MFPPKSRAAWRSFSRRDLCGTHQPSAGPCKAMTDDTAPEESRPATVRSERSGMYHGFKGRGHLLPNTLLAKRAPLAQRLRERSGVDILELAADRNASRQAAHSEPARAQQLADVVRRRFALVGEVGREDCLFHDAVGRALQQPIEMD